jgi:hypothetical protein
VPTPVSVALLIGAVVLPYVAVVLANAGRERPQQADPFLEITRQLGPGPDPLAPPQPGQPQPAQTQRPGDAAPRGDRPLWDHDGRTWDPAAHPDGHRG